jgi:molybdopterin converting factor subunit 1
VQYQVKLFAALKERAGTATWQFESDQPLKGSALLSAFFESHPQLAQLKGVTRLAVNHSFCEQDPTLAESDEIAFIPPVSGG